MIIEEMISRHLVDVPENTSAFLTGDYIIRSIRTRVFTNDKYLLHAIDEILQPFRVHTVTDKPAISFYIFKADKTVSLSSSIKRQAEELYSCRLFCCWDHGAYRWLEVPNKGTGMCDLERNIGFALVNSDSLKASWAIGHYIFFPLWIQMLKKSGLFHLHGACVSMGGKGLLFPGPTGCGKTTLAINLVRNGFKLLADDTVFLATENEHLTINGFLDRVRMRTGSMSLFPELGLPKLGDTDGRRPKLNFDIRDVYGECLEDTATPQAVVLLRYTGEPTTVIKPIQRVEALTRLFRYSLFMADPYSNERQFEILSQLVNEVPCFQAEIGNDNRESSLLLRELLEGVAA